MTELHFSLEAALDLSGPVSFHAFVLRLVPPTTPAQEILSASVTTDPPVPLSRSTDAFGNTVLSGRLDAPHVRLAYRLEGTARMSPEVPDRVPGQMFLRHATPLTRAGAAVRRLLEGMPAAGDPLAEGLALMQAVHSRMAYTPGSTTTRTSAEQALQQGCGVCQDYAHILLAALRSRGISCRYVSGMFLGEGASHAWVELWDGQRWQGLDPTHNCRTDGRYIKIAQGADFSDCPLDSGVFCGSVTQSMTVQARVASAACQ